MSMVTDYAAMILHRERAGRLLAEAEAGRLRSEARAARKGRAGRTESGTGRTDPTKAESDWVRAA